jgi:hypothetical protein
MSSKILKGKFSEAEDNIITKVVDCYLYEKNKKLSEVLRIFGTRQTDRALLKQLKAHLPHRDSHVCIYDLVVNKLLA